jgi:hypothetical protein
MKKIFTAIVAMMLAAPSFAQYSSGGFELDKDNIYYGIRLGMTAANLSGDTESPRLESGSKVGMTLAGVVGLRVSESTPLFLESGLYYTERGAKNIGYSNLEIPLLIKYGIKATDDIAVLPFVGPYFSRACWGKTKQYQYTLDNNLKPTNEVEKVGTFDEKKAATGGLNRLNMGFKIGCAAEYNKLYLELGYQIGVSNIAKDDKKTIHSNAFFANFGVNF